MSEADAKFSDDTDAHSVDPQWELDYKAFIQHRVMKPGYEEKRDGNPALEEIRKLAAPIFARGAAINTAEKATLAKFYNTLYYKEPLAKMLQVAHPSTKAMRLTKDDIIARIIQSNLGFPTIDGWLTIFAQGEKLDDEGSDDDDGKGDLSKAARHSRRSNVMDDKKPSEPDGPPPPPPPVVPVARKPVKIVKKDWRRWKNHSTLLRGDKRTQEGSDDHSTDEAPAKRQRNNDSTSIQSQQVDNSDSESSAPLPLKTADKKVAAAPNKDNRSGHGQRRQSEAKRDDGKVGNRSGRDDRHARSTRAVDRAWDRRMDNERRRARQRAPARHTQRLVDRRERRRVDDRRTRRRDRSSDIEFARQRRSERQEQPVLHINRPDDFKASASPTRTFNSLMDQHRREADLVKLIDEKMSSFKLTLHSEVAKAYEKGRQDADSKSLEQWLPAWDTKLIEKAKLLLFIDMDEVRAAQGKGKAKDKKLVLTGDGDIKAVEEDAIKDKEQIKWLEYLSLFSDLMDLYLIQGGHINKLDQMLTHYRLMQRLGKERIFTFESIQAWDRHVRSRPEGQGPNFTWKFDGAASRYLYLKEYRPAAVSDKSASRAKAVKKKVGVCFEWWQMKECSRADCKFAHHCAACGVSKPQKHVLEKCAKKDAVKITKKRARDA